MNHPAKCVARVEAEGGVVTWTKMRDGSVLLDRRVLTSRTTMTRTVEHLKPRGRRDSSYKHGSDAALRSGAVPPPHHHRHPRADSGGGPDADDADDYYTSCVINVVFNKIESDDERRAGEEAELRGGGMLASRLFGDAWASVVLPPAAAGTPRGASPVAWGSGASVPDAASLSGAWVVDKSRSDSLEPFLKEIGLPPAARKVCHCAACACACVCVCVRVCACVCVLCVFACACLSACACRSCGWIGHTCVRRTLFPCGVTWIGGAGAGNHCQRAASSPRVHHGGQEQRVREPHRAVA
jgi:hypothetical protein